MLVTSLATPLPLEQIGGKAHSLQRMIAAGWRVPAGFVVTTAAFPAAISAAIPPALVVAVREALESLGTSQSLAVRSSAVGEDSREAAYAGLLETRLQVPPTLDDVLAAILVCWRSYHSPRVLEYQRARGTTLRGMAVIIQQMAQGKFSGVMFTRHPAPTREQAAANSLLIEYCQGLGDQLVSGQVTPQSLSVERTPGNTPAERPRDRAECASELPAGVVETLVGAADALELLFGGPQDVEWTCDADGNVDWLQSRPVTVIAARNEDRPAKTSRRGPRQRWTNANLNENYPDPVSPLLASLAPQCYYHYFRNLGLALGVSPRRVAGVESELRSLVGTHGGRLYYNLSHIERVLAAAPFGEWLQSAFLDFIGAAHEKPANDDTQADGGLMDSPNGRSSFASRCRDGFETARIAWRAVRLVRSLEPRIAAFERDVRTYAADAHPRRLPTSADDELRALWQRFAEIRFQRWLPGSIADAASMVSYALLKRTLRREFPDDEHGALHNGLLRGLRDVVSAKSAESLWEISRQVRANPAWMRWLESPSSSADKVETLATDPALAPLRDQLDDWLEQWGFRCSGELLLTIPSYQEQPETVVELLRTYVASEQESPAARLERQSRLRQEETDRVLSILRTRRRIKSLPWPSRAVGVRRLISATQRAIVCRERARLQQALLYQRLRRLVLELGRRWTARSIVAAPEDLFFLTWQEVESLLSGDSSLGETAQTLVQARRAQWERDRTLHPPENLVFRPGETWPAWNDSPSAVAGTAPRRSSAADVGAEGAIQRGIAACSGVVEGRACVMEDVRQVDRLQPGDILVVRQTDPGWATVFPLVRGLVMERGGMLSHGAILAREYGLPTVVGIADATTRYADAPRIRVDGNRGEVQPIRDDDSKQRTASPDARSVQRDSPDQGTDS